MIGPGLSLQQQIDRATAANETRIFEQINLPKLAIEGEELQHFRRFKQFCAQKGLRDLPAKPGTICAWIQNEVACGLAVEAIEASLRGIELAHSNANFANPVACPAPRAELEKIIKTKPPRSWRAYEAGIFAALPPDVRAIVARRAREDELALRRLQNSVAALRNQQQKEKSDD